AVGPRPVGRMPPARLGAVFRARATSKTSMLSVRPSARSDAGSPSTPSASNPGRTDPTIDSLTSVPRLSFVTCASVAAAAGPAAAVIAVGAPVTPTAARPAIFDARLGAACRGRALLVIRVLMFLGGATSDPT